MIVTFAAVALGFGLWLFALRRYDRIEPESLPALLVTAVVGGLGFFVAAVANEVAAATVGLDAGFGSGIAGLMFAQIAVYCVLVGFVEEVVKAFGTIVISRRPGWMDEPVDGMLYAMTVALGFAAVENIVYAQAHGSGVLVVRFLWPVPAHLGYAAVWGYGLARARFGAPRGRSAFAVSVVAASLLHGIANIALLFQSRHRLAPLVSFVALVGLAVLAHRRLRVLAAQSPFLEAGECAACRNLNPPARTSCLYCGEPLLEHATPRGRPASERAAERRRAVRS